MTHGGLTGHFWAKFCPKWVFWAKISSWLNLNQQSNRNYQLYALPKPTSNHFQSFSKSTWTHWWLTGDSPGHFLAKFCPKWVFWAKISTWLNLNQQSNSNYQFYSLPRSTSNHFQNLYGLTGDSRGHFRAKFCPKWGFWAKISTWLNLNEQFNSNYQLYALPRPTSNHFQSFSKSTWTHRGLTGDSRGISGPNFAQNEYFELRYPLGWT